MTDTTVVVFRVFDGEVIALFPDIPADYAGKYCMSYAHIGQHGSADYQYVIDNSVPATTHQQAALFFELEDIGYLLAEPDTEPIRTHAMYYQPTMELTGLFPSDFIWEPTWDGKLFRRCDLWIEQWIAYQNWQLMRLL